MRPKAIQIPLDLAAELDALPDTHRRAWTEEQDALLVRYWGKKDLRAVTEYFQRKFGHTHGATKFRVTLLRERGEPIGAYMKPRHAPQKGV